MRRWAAMAALLFLTAGCGHYNIPMVEVAASPADVIQKVPLNVAILMPDELENFVYTGQTGVSIQGTFTFPLGQIIKKNALDTLSPAFNKAVMVKGKPYPQDTDAVIVLKVKDFKHWFENAGPATDKVLARISVAVAIHNREGMLIWNGVINSPVIPGTYSSFSGSQWLEATGRVAAESVVAALQESAKAITSSQSVHAFISSGGASKTAAAEPTGKKLPAVRSDVDELPAVKVKPNRNAYAVVIGIEQYRQKLPNADFATRDAKTVTEYLTKVMGYPEENVVTLLNEHATNVDLVKYFEKWLPNNLEKDSSLFVYYSGHGAPNAKTLDAYLVPYDGDPAFIDQTGYPLKKLYESLDKLQAKEILVVLDSCFSGAGGKSVMAKGARPLVMNLNQNAKGFNNMRVLSAAAGDQISSTYDEKGHGLLTYFLLKGIKNEDVVKQDGSLDVDELYSYIRPQVERIARKQYNNEQTPQLSEGKKK